MSFKEAYKEMDQETVRQYLLTEGCDTQFKMNVPSASHMGGVWERKISSVKNVLAATVGDTVLDNESLRTYMAEVMAIVNGRPLTVDNMSDTLAPNKLLTMKSRVIVAPLGNFQRTDRYSTKRWHRVQHLVNEFWRR